MTHGFRHRGSTAEELDGIQVLDVRDPRIEAQQQHGKDEHFRARDGEHAGSHLALHSDDLPHRRTARHCWPPAHKAAHTNTWHFAQKPTAGNLLLGFDLVALVHGHPERQSVTCWQVQKQN